MFDLSALANTQTIGTRVIDGRHHQYEIEGQAADAALQKTAYELHENRSRNLIKLVDRNTTMIVLTVAAAVAQPISKLPIMRNTYMSMTSEA